MNTTNNKEQAATDSFMKKGHQSIVETLNKENNKGMETVEAEIIELFRLLIINDYIRDRFDINSSHPFTIKQIVEVFGAQWAKQQSDGDRWVSVEIPPKTQGDGKEYLCRGIKGTKRNLPDAESYADYVVCWYDDNTFYCSHGNWKAYNDNNDLMELTHYMPLPSPPTK